MDSGVRTLSSRQTFMVKFILPIFWISLVGLGTLGLWVGSIHGKDGASPPDVMKWQFLLIWIVGTAIFWWSFAGLKRVRVGNGLLYVSNYQQEISIPLTMISRVTENRWTKTHTVTIYFRSPTEFGERIKFMPKVRFVALWSSHPVVSELRQLANLTGNE